MSAPEPSFSISQTDAGGIRELTLVGRLDSQSESTAIAAFLPATESHARVLIDCSKLTFLSSAGLRAIVLAHRSAVEKGGRIVVLVSPSPIADAFRISGLARIISIHPSRADALEGLK